MHVPINPVDPLALQVASYLQSDPVWRGMKTRSVAETRALFKAAAPRREGLPVAHVEDFTVAVADGAIPVRLYRPVPKPPAMIVWFHGGGFTLGSVAQCDAYVRELATKTGCAVVSVDYRLAPEHKFPTAVNDALAATRWVANHRDMLVGSAVPLFLAGDSAGGNLATVAARKLHETSECEIAGQILAYPCTDTIEAESLRRFEPPYLTIADLRWFFEQYVPDLALQSDPDFAPIRAANLDKMPPTLIITAEHDILAEQGQAYGRKLAAAGVDVRMSQYPGMMHGFLVSDVFFAGAAGKAMTEISDFTASVLSG